MGTRLPPFDVTVLFAESSDSACNKPGRLSIVPQLCCLVFACFNLAFRVSWQQMEKLSKFVRTQPSPPTVHFATKFAGSESHSPRCTFSPDDKSSSGDNFSSSSFEVRLFWINRQNDKAWRVVKRSSALSVVIR